jgi:D-amino peptidase
MKAFISIDLEGLPYIVIPGHLILKGVLYKEARKIATDLTHIVSDELNKNGFDEIIIADSHGPMVNLLVDDLPEYVEIIRGPLRPTSMVAGVEECDAAIFLGYHSKFGTAKSTFDHTYSGASIRQLEMNGVAVSEFLLNAYTAGDYNVPVILVAGDAELLKEDVNKYAPWAKTVPLKYSLSRLAARSPSFSKIEDQLREAVRNAVTDFNSQTIKPLKTSHPVKTKITFHASHFADAADLLPFINRIDGLSVEYIASNVIDAYKVFQLLVLAAFGLTSSIAQLR